MPDIQWALSSLRARQDAYQAANDYYDGKHKLSFATEDFKHAFGNLFRAFAENLMPAVVDAVRDRLKLSGFTVHGTKKQKGPLEPNTPEAAILEIWRRNLMDQRAGRVHLQVLKTGDAYLIVWPDAGGFPVIYPNKATAVTVRYDDETPGRIIYAAKAWVTPDQKARLTLYFEDRIEKYVTRNKVQGGLPDTARSFIRFEQDGERWPLDNPYMRVPVFHFANNADIGEFGVCEHKDAIPLQDGLNKSLADMLICGEYHSLPQRWATGIELPIDPQTGKPLNPFLPGEFWAAKAKEAQFGQLEAANLEQFIKAKNGWKEDISAVTGTPWHYLNPVGASPPSGEAIKTVETRLSAKVYDRQVSFGNSWETAFRFCLEIAKFPDVDLDSVWEDTQPRDETVTLNNSVTKVEKLGGSRRQAWREQGYSDEEIDDIFEEATTEDVVNSAIEEDERETDGEAARLA